MYRASTRARWLLFPAIVMIPVIVLLVSVVASMPSGAKSKPSHDDAMASIEKSSPDARDVVSHGPPTTDPSLPAAANVLTPERAADAMPVNTF